MDQTRAIPTIEAVASINKQVSSKGHFQIFDGNSTTHYEYITVEYDRESCKGVHLGTSPEYLDLPGKYIHFYGLPRAPILGLQT